MPVANALAINPKGIKEVVLIMTGRSICNFLDDVHVYVVDYNHLLQVVINYTQF
jgi:hypothetical protein